MRFDILTLFPEMVEGVLSQSITGRALAAGIFELKCHDIRDYTNDKHLRCDDYPYGGGCGMVMSAQPVVDCFEGVVKEAGSRPHLIYMSPKGKVFTQSDAKRLAGYENIAILCGHYEGLDERAIDLIVDEEISIGDFVLTGGEIPAMAVVDCIARMIPGVLKEENGFIDESHFDHLLEYPQYTRPEEFRGLRVPDVLLSGHHENIDKWRRQMKLSITFERRPDMLEEAELTADDIKYLRTLGWDGQRKEQDAK